MFFFNFNKYVENWADRLMIRCFTDGLDIWDQGTDENRTEIGNAT